MIKNKNTKEEPRLLRNLFSKVFTSHFSNEDLLIFEKDELITSSLLAFVKNKESCYIVGTNKGKVY